MVSSAVPLFGHHRDAAGLADGGEDVVGAPALELLGPWFAGGDVEGAKADLISSRRRALVPVRRQARRVSRVAISSWLLELSGFQIT